MRAYSPLPQVSHDAIMAPPDAVQTLLLASSAGQAFGWQTSAASTAANARAAGAAIVRFTGFTTAATPAAVGFMVNLVSTHANNPTSGSSHTTGTTAGSTGNSIPVFGSRTFQIPAWSTGWSAIAIGGAYVIAEIWSR